MSGRRERALRQTAHTSPQRNVGNRHRTGARHHGGRRRWSWISWKSGLTALGVVAVVAVVAVILILPRLAGTASTPVPSEAKLAAQLGVAEGTGLPVGTAVPKFSGEDVVSGKTITSASIYDHKTLLFLSEGVMCQACLQQIQGLQQVASSLQQRGIQLISITPDSAGTLTQAASDYGITTPLIPDPDRTISSAFNTLGLGMHANTPGHAFALVYQGKILWSRDYYQPPYNTMYVAPPKLLAAIPSS
jgi:peroxiredoxin